MAAGRRREQGGGRGCATNLLTAPPASGLRTSATYSPHQRPLCLSCVPTHPSTCSPPVHLYTPHPPCPPFPTTCIPPVHPSRPSAPLPCIPPVHLHPSRPPPGVCRVRHHRSVVLPPCKLRRRARLPPHRPAPRPGPLPGLFVTGGTGTHSGGTHQVSHHHGSRNLVSSRGLPDAHSRCPVLRVCMNVASQVPVATPPVLILSPCLYAPPAAITSQLLVTLQIPVTTLCPFCRCPLTPLCLLAPGAQARVWALPQAASGPGCAGCAVWLLHQLPAAPAAPAHKVHHGEARQASGGAGESRRRASDANVCCAPQQQGRGGGGSDIRGQDRLKALGYRCCTCGLTHRSPHPCAGPGRSLARHLAPGAAATDLACAAALARACCRQKMRLIALLSSP